MTEEKRKPNVLLICCDHWPASLLKSAGHPVIQTPTLDWLANNGVRFSNAYSECPVCVPARRTLMTSLLPHDHNMLTNQSKPMPDVTTLAQAFCEQGYQAYGVGKLHVQPQRQRLGFDDVLIDEEGRGSQGCRQDDYELFLGDMGYAGQRYAGGMSNNEYLWRAWHLPENLHCTNWTAQQMCRYIIRRDPLRPSFWYMGFSHPHPPMEPLQTYLDLYKDFDIPEPYMGDWAEGDTVEPFVEHDHQRMKDVCRDYNAEEIKGIRRAFYAMCTHIDHQLRVVIGTLRQEGLLGETIICFTSDHGDMLGNHGYWAKHWMYEDSANVPMLLKGTADQATDGTVGSGRHDDRLVGLADVMPTLLELAGLDVPDHCKGQSMISDKKRDLGYSWFGSVDENSHMVNRMVRDPQYKFIYYPFGNTIQLFDMLADPHELNNLAGDGKHDDIVEGLKQKFIESLQEEERQAWLTDGELTGWPAQPLPEGTHDGWASGQRGIQWPPPFARKWD